MTETRFRDIWNKGAAAAKLGIDRSTLWRKMRRLGIA
jgi:transcriptional regulator of acetoin/glycerol metabolism